MTVNYVNKGLSSAELLLTEGFYFGAARSLQGCVEPNVNE